MPRGDPERSAEKVMEILVALAEIQVFVTGFEHLDAREAYSLLWNQTLWEGCYLEKGTPGAITVIDASHMMSKPDIEQFLKDLERAARLN